MLPDLLARLSRYADRDLRPGAGKRPNRPALWTFLARDREHYSELRVDRTILVVVIEGCKEIADRRGLHRFARGSTLLLPAGWTGTVVNEPDGRSGQYRALVLEFPGDMVRRLLSAHPRQSARQSAPSRPRPPDSRIALTPTLAEAVLHTAAGLTADPPASPHIVEHRCMEVLLALLEEGTWWLGPGTPGSTAEAVRQLVRAHPDRPWTSDSVARELGLSPATLRRRLAGEDCSLRALLRDERVAHARHLLETDGLSVQEAAEACGYASRSHFARRVRSATGANPSHLRLAEKA